MRIIIITTRKESATSNAVRQFRVPSLNFNAQDYIDIVSCPNIDTLEPPLMKHISDEDLQECVKLRTLTILLNFHVLLATLKKLRDASDS